MSVPKQSPAVQGRLDLLELAFDLAEFDLTADAIWDEVCADELAEDKFPRSPGSNIVGHSN